MNPGSSASQPRDDLREHARRLVADWPTLSPEQRTRLAILLRPNSPSHATAPTRRAA